MTRYILGEFEIQVQIAFVSLERSFQIQSWCEDTFGPAETAKWALGYNTETQQEYQSWYFAHGRDAMLFKLRWS